MWIFFSGGFLSVVHKAPARKDELLVRARRQGDIEKLFPNAAVRETVGVDYLYRAVIKRSEVAEVMTKLAMELDYDNFKDSIQWGDKQLKEACSRVWSVMASTQRIAPYSSLRSRAGLFDDVELEPVHRSATFAKKARGRR